MANSKTLFKDIVAQIHLSESKEEADRYLAKSPLYKYWTYDIEELFVYDGQLYRLPTVQLN